MRKRSKASMQLTFFCNFAAVFKHLQIWLKRFIFLGLAASG